MGELEAGAVHDRLICCLCGGGGWPALAYDIVILASLIERILRSVV